MNEAVKSLKEEMGEDPMLLVREFAETVAFYQRLLERCETDALTGLPGNNRFHDFREGIEDRAESVGVIFFDINGLKDVNDTKGHAAGDRLIQKAGESIHEVLAEGVHAFRAGGDEFVIVMTNCREQDVTALLENWRGKLDELNRRGDGVFCSVSAGWAYGGKGYRMSDVMKLADEHMYEEKKQNKGTTATKQIMV
jgi:diguanylate cyclase (GGDEF)-like protein